jgi:hypothetical protein
LKRWMPDLSDVFVVLGCALVVAGVWQVHRPSALVVAGMLMCILALIGGTYGRTR